MKNKCDYRASIILGMHDAIVSLTGLIAGLFFAFTNTNIIVVSCIVSSVSASLSMGAANYLAVKSSNRELAIQSAFSTMLAYMITCVILITPFFIFNNRWLLFTSVIALSVFIILGFNLYFYYEHGFYKHFAEMLLICTVVSVVSFFIGEMANNLF